MGQSFLKEYIKRVFQLEILQYEQTKVCSDIRQTISEIQNKQSTPLKKKESYDVFGNLVLGGSIGVIFAFIYLIIDALKPRGLGRWNAMRSLEKTIIIFLVVSIIVFLIGIFITKPNNKKIARDNKIIEQKNAVDFQRRVKYCEQLKQRLTVAEQTLFDTQKVLNTYYGKGIIFPKYRNLVAVSSFYEYLSSGRCTNLEGHEGAYNLFENELRLNIILVKLDDIIERLDDIRSNQYALYAAISKSNKNINHLRRSLSNMQNNMELTAYNGRITAQNTEFLKWITFLR